MEERVLIIGAALYILYVAFALGPCVDPILNFMLFPTAALFLAFLEVSEWIRASRV